MVLWYYKNQWKWFSQWWPLVPCGTGLHLGGLLSPLYGPFWGPHTNQAGKQATRLGTLIWINKANLRDLIAVTGLVILLKWLINEPMWPWNLINDLKKTVKHLFYATSSFVQHFKAIGILYIDTGVTVRKRSIWVKIGYFFVPPDLENWRNFQKQ